VLTLAEFCNQIIHSFNWTVVRNEYGGLGGVFFSSDRARRKVLYFADIDLIVVLLREIGYDGVVSMSMIREVNGDLKVTSLLGADTRTARYEWLMTGHGRASRPPGSL
jgi:putative aminopeptidase FrvX